MYKPKYKMIFLDETNTWVKDLVIGGPRYNQWAHKNKYTQAINNIIFVTVNSLRIRERCSRGGGLSNHPGRLRTECVQRAF
jgi:hypothetical protein